MSEPIRAAHAREAWLAAYIASMRAGARGDSAILEADKALRAYIARFGDPDLCKDMDECTAVGGAG